MSQQTSSDTVSDVPAASTTSQSVKVAPPLKLDSMYLFLFDFDRFYVINSFFCLSPSYHSTLSTTAWSPSW
jgi:hypothetical protein